MSEKAACPKCDSYVSEVYYEGRHEWCGWNCNVRYEVSASGPHGFVTLRTADRPSSDLQQRVARLADADGTRVQVLVDGATPELLSAWLDPEQEPPQPISERTRKANLKALRDKREAEMRAADGF